MNIIIRDSRRTHETLINTERVNPHEIEEVVKNAINQHIEIIDPSDEYKRTLYTYGITYKTISTKHGKIVNDTKTIAHHTEELTNWLECFTQEKINYRKNQLFERGLY